MGVQSLDGEQATGLSDLLAIGFGTTVAMWAVGYVGHMPLTDVPPLVFVSLMLVCLLAGGWTVGRKTPPGCRRRFGTGPDCRLAQFARPGQHPGQAQLRPTRTAGLALGARLLRRLPGTRGCGGNRGNGPSCQLPSPTFGSGAGGKGNRLAPGFRLDGLPGNAVVDLHRRTRNRFSPGMAVPDWPNTYGSNMFLYPLAKMTGGVFYEHAHRLLGSLVGLTTLVLAILLTIHRRSTGAVVLIWIVGACVLLQGIAGGFRVTDNSTHLAVVHGFFAHVILAGMIGVAVLLAPRARMIARSRAGEIGGHAPLPNETDVFLATLLVLAILGQTLLGTLVRQMDVGLMIHLSVAMFVAVLAIVVGVRMWGLYPHIVVFARGGVAVMSVVILQLILGGISLVFRTPPAKASPSAEQLQAGADALCPAVHAILTTAHQTTAAVLLAIAALLAFWAWRWVVMQGFAAPPRRPRRNRPTLRHPRFNRKVASCCHS